MTIEEKIQIELEFLKKYPNDILNSWDESHHDLPQIIEENNYQIGVEIGVAYGGHVESILTKTKVLKIYGIDPYKNYSDYDGDTQNFEQLKLDDIYDMVTKRLSFYGNRFELIREFSHDCVSRFDDNSLDFVYIDGNHYEDYVKRDIDNWWPKIKLGGVISGHDYNHPSIPHLTTCVNQFFSKIDLQVIDLNNHNWCVIKK
jgi:hypothetical protein